MEAAGIAGFVFVAGSFTVFLEHPSLPVMRSWLWHYPVLRRALLGICLGVYVTFTVKLFGKRSGAHVNPSVTVTFYRLGNISLINATCYIIAQFLGALAGFYIVKLWAGNLFSYPLIDYGVSKPQPPHTTMDAFVAEFIISFVLMLTLLFVSSSRKMEKGAALFIGLLIALYITFELPYSGMSLNPARSFAAALGANEWTHVWIYFVSPVLAMLLAAELFIIWKKKRIAKKHEDYKEIGMYPVVKNKTE